MHERDDGRTLSKVSECAGPSSPGLKMGAAVVASFTAADVGASGKVHFGLLDRKH